MKFKAKALASSVAVIALTSHASLSFATCAAGTAAQNGSQIGFQRAQTNAQNLAMNETSAQQMLQKCLQSLANQSMTAFPSLANILDQVVQQVCYAASNEINSAVGQISPTSEISSVTGSINSSISNATGGMVGHALSLTPNGTGTALPANTNTTPPNFWNSVWN